MKTTQRIFYSGRDLTIIGDTTPSDSLRRNRHTAHRLLQPARCRSSNNWYESFIKPVSKLSSTLFLTTPLKAMSWDRHFVLKAWTTRLTTASPEPQAIR